MATQQREVAAPDILRKEDACGPDSANPHRMDTRYGWPSKRVEPVNLLRDEGRTRRGRLR